jgi:fatty-acyl-CoA synthase
VPEPEPRRRPSPAGFPDETAGTEQRALLDAIIGATIPDPPCVDRLALPRPERWSPGHVSALIEAGPELTWGAGVVFGGYLTCVIDLFAGFAAMTVLPDGFRFLTADLETTFHVPVAPGPIAVEASVDELSARRAVVSVRLRQNDRVAVSARTTQLLIRVPDPDRAPAAPAVSSTVVGSAAVSPNGAPRPAPTRGEPVDPHQSTTGTYVDHVLKSLAEHGDREAFVQGDQRVSYAEARLTILRLAAALRLRGLGKGETVALFVGSHPESVMIQLAVHLAGCRLVFVAPEPALPEQGAFLRRSEAAALIIDPRIARAVDLAREHGPRITLTAGPADLGEDLLALADEQSGEPLEDPAEVVDIATIFYTGGTTGRPKLVLHRHSYYYALIPASERRRAEIPIPHRFLICTPASHTSGHIAAILTLLAGGTVVLMNGFDAGEAIRLLSEERITSLGLVPPMLGELLDHPSFPEAGFPDLFRIHYGGAPTTPARIRQAIDRFGPILRQTYGLTEVPVITFLEPQDHDLTIPGRLGSCGKPLPGLADRAEISLRDEKGGEVAAGGIGEVCIRGPLVMSEYWNDPELTAQAMADGWLHTGDLGFFDDEGFLHIVDRLKDVIVTGQTSDNVFSNLLEDVLTSTPGVLAASVVGLPDDAWGEAVYVACVVDGKTPVDSADLSKRAVEELGPLYEPKAILFVDSLPWTALGKIDKKAVRALLLESQK